MLACIKTALRVFGQRVSTFYASPINAAIENTFVLPVEEDDAVLPIRISQRMRNAMKTSRQKCSRFREFNF
jgi:hypothetical protein